MVRTSVDEVHEARTAVKLSKENSGISLRFRGLDPLKARPYATILATTFAQHSTSVAAHPHSEIASLPTDSIVYIRLD